MEFLVDGFRNGFDIGYQGLTNRTSQSRNIPFTPGVGDKHQLWEKIMKEVHAGRFAGPFNKVPVENYIQSPIGLVPKSGGKTRLIFHLSYKFVDGIEDVSLNQGTPRDKCSVKYQDIDAAVECCLHLSENGKHTVFLAKTDASNAFRVLPLKQSCFQ